MTLCDRLFVALCFAAFSGIAFSDDSLCVKTVSTKVLSNHSGAVAGWKKVGSSTDRSSEPLIFSQEHDSKDVVSSLAKVRSQIFGISPKGLSLTGPYDLDFRFESFALNPKSGELLILGERESGDGIGPHTTDKRHYYEKTLFQFDFTRKPSSLPNSISESLKWPTAISWSGILDGVLIRSVTSEFVFKGVSLLRNNEIFGVGGLSGFNFAEDLPSHAVVALYDGYSLHFINRNLTTLLKLDLAAGKEDGLYHVFELQNDWLYVAGGNFSYAVHLVKGARWTADKIVPLVRDRYFDQEHGLLEAFGHWLSYHVRFGIFDAMKHVSGDREPIHIHGGDQYSAVLKTVFFNDEKAMLVNGELIPFGAYDWFVGDVPFAGITLFWDAKGLYSYDGKAIKRAEGAPLKRGDLTVLPSLRRAFYRQINETGIYELVIEQGRVKPRRLESIDGTFLDTEFYELEGSDAVAVMTKHQIFSLQGGRLKPIWKTNYSVASGWFSPFQSSRMKGVLFATTDPESKPRFKFVAMHWLGLCSATL